MTLRIAVFAPAVLIAGLASAPASADEVPSLDDHFAKHKGKVEAYAKCMVNALEDDEERTVEDARKVCDTELGEMKVTIPDPEWERALELIEDSVPEIKTRKEEEADG